MKHLKLLAVTLVLTFAIPSFADWKETAVIDATRKFDELLAESKEKKEHKVFVVEMTVTACLNTAQDISLTSASKSRIRSIVEHVLAGDTLSSHFIITTLVHCLGERFEGNLEDPDHPSQEEIDLIISVIDRAFDRIFEKDLKQN